ncbi:glycosyltransferase family 2 protein [Candidatus Gottesmanbacteria bacterium]|nr:glycosyltransferase family 2 protein [Candidatus Gottesmanbacteria bacterium]
MSLKNGKKYKIAAIVPVYNEEKNVYGVLNALTRCKQLNEIICIDDGSKDNTVVLTKKFKSVKLIIHPKNSGKSNAIITGIKSTNADIVVFIDGDLKGINNQTIYDLTEPLVDGSYDSVVGYYRNYTFDEFFRPVSGERAYFRKDLLPYLNQFKNIGYGLELKLNYLFKNKRVKVFKFNGIKHDLKYEKQPFRLVVKLILRETRDFLNQVITAEKPVDFVKNAYFARFYFTQHQDGAGFTKNK